jgi:hypothetical protein
MRIDMVIKLRMMILIQQSAYHVQENRSGRRERYSQQGNMRQNEMIESYIQLKNIKFDRRFKSKKGINIGKCRC